MTYEWNMITLIGIKIFSYYWATKIYIITSLLFMSTLLLDYILYTHIYKVLYIFNAHFVYKLKLNVDVVTRSNSNNGVLSSKKFWYQISQLLLIPLAKNHHARLIIVVHIIVDTELLVN